MGTEIACRSCAPSVGTSNCNAILYYQKLHSGPVSVLHILEDSITAKLRRVHPACDLCANQTYRSLNINSRRNELPFARKFIAIAWYLQYAIAYKGLARFVFYAANNSIRDRTRK